MFIIWQTAGLLKNYCVLLDTQHYERSGMSMVVHQGVDVESNSVIQL